MLDGGEVAVRGHVECGVAGEEVGGFEVDCVDFYGPGGGWVSGTIGGAEGAGVECT